MAMETSIEIGKTNKSKPEMPLQLNGNKQIRNQCIQSFSQANKLAADHVHSEIKRNIHSFEKSSKAKHSAAASKVDAATMTEAPSESYCEQEVCSKSPYYEVRAMVPATSAWHNFSGAAGTAMVEYLSRLSASTLPLTLHNFLKYSAATNEQSNLSIANKLLKEKLDLKNEPLGKNDNQSTLYPTLKEKSNDIHLTAAMDGSMLFCCPECHMAYPEKELLQQHLVVHQLERRFVCDICGAGLKRKEHLDRHKQGHSPDRPYTCSICLKAFKRNEHLSRHFITHSGDKSQICIECGKGFYRKDHLHKHAQSHIAKRLRTEFYGKKGDINTSFMSSNETSVSLRSDATIHMPVLSS